MEKKTLVFDAHEHFTEVIEVVNRKRIQKTLESVESFIVPKINHAYTVNQSLATLFKNEYATPFEVIRNIATLEKAVFPIEKEFDIIYVGAVMRKRYKRDH